jgi:uncharacterized protein (DUF3820 family)
MRRFDKKNNIRKANLLAEQRYLAFKNLNEDDFNNQRNYYKGEDGKYYDNDNQEIKEFMIGYANKYYTLWGVLKAIDALKYVYIKNLSTDLETAKAKAKTDKVNEKLRGKTNTFYKVRYSNGLEQDVDEDTYKGWIKTILPFGKYGGESIFNIAIKDPGYLAWFILNTKPSEKLKALVTSFDSVKELLQKEPKHIEQVKTSNNLTQLAKQSFKSFDLDWTLDNSDQTKPKYTSNSLDVTTTMKTVLASKPYQGVGRKPKFSTKKLILDGKGTEKLVEFKNLKSVIYTTSSFVDVTGREIDNSSYVAVINVKNIDFNKYPEFINYPDELSNKDYKLNGYFEMISVYNDGTEPFILREVKFIVNSVELI